MQQGPVCGDGLHGARSDVLSPSHPILGWLGRQALLPPLELHAYLPGGRPCLLDLPEARERSLKSLPVWIPEYMLVQYEGNIEVEESQEKLVNKQ